MRLEREHLEERHNFWKEEIAKTGIWKAEHFKDISIQIRPKSKRYNGVFSRRWLKKQGNRVLIDKITIYNNSEDFDPVFLDSVLVHEMIHQYMFQNQIKDSSTHGKVFKHYMNKINEAFPEYLEIRLKDHNPSVPVKGPGLTIHNLILSWTEEYCYCCLIHPKRLNEFDRMVKRYKKRGMIKGYTWAQSVDVHFNQYVRCMKRLHGIRKRIPDMKDFCKEYNVIEIGEKWLTLRKA